jgi:hypothetical protein
MALLLIVGGGTVGITAFPHSQPHRSRCPQPSMIFRSSTRTSRRCSS